MGWFDKKVAADDGVILVGCSIALSTIDLVGANPDGEALAAFCTSYVGFRGQAFGASPLLARSDRLWQAAWHTLTIEHSYFRERMPAFAMSYVGALKALDTEAPNAHFFDVHEELVGWHLGRDACLELMRTIRDSAEDVLTSKSRTWK